MGGICKCKQIFWTHLSSFFHKLYLQEMMALMNEARRNKNMPQNWKTIKTSILKPDQNMLAQAKQQQFMPLVNLVICPICKETLWGAKKYADHLRTMHDDKR